jgi:hypothetical protein
MRIEAGVILEILALVAGATIAFFGLVLLGLELQYRSRPEEKVEINSSQWKLDSSNPYQQYFVGVIEFWSVPRENGVVISECQIHATLITKRIAKPTNCQFRILDISPYKPRPDHYWNTCILEKEPLQVEVRIAIDEPDVEILQSLWLRLELTLYTRAGHLLHTGYVEIPANGTIVNLFQPSASKRTPTPQSVRVSSPEQHNRIKVPS